MVQLANFLCVFEKKHHVNLDGERDVWKMGLNIVLTTIQGILSIRYVFKFGFKIDNYNNYAWSKAYF